LVQERAVSTKETVSPARRRKFEPPRVTLAANKDKNGAFYDGVYPDSRNTWNIFYANNISLDHAGVLWSEEKREKRT
jgi:hypothetical protein